MLAFPPPAIPGIGATGGFNMQLEALGGQSPEELASVMQSFVVAANGNPVIERAYSTFSASVPTLRLNVDRVKAENLGVPVSTLFTTLQAQLGSLFVNDFNAFGRTYQVNLAADQQFRGSIDDILNLYVRNKKGQMVPVRTIATVEPDLGPILVMRYNNFASATINGSTAPGYSSGQAIEALKQVAADSLPRGYGYEWSGLTYQEVTAAGQVGLIFLLAITFGYLFLVGQYESWSVPFAVITSVTVAVL
ncbi:MAG: hydrophobe/amphiphile efflux-1 family RND transporter, partial [Kiloniellaceae bacterium]|nr:hydrophobe/amphiphile efflux-1 family RND transporter [Kiloniellaceae bacterium]